MKGHFEIAKLLLQSGPYVDAKNNMGNTALHQAAYQGRPKFVEVLLKHGARKDLKNVRNETALEFATCFKLGNFREVEALLK